MISLRYLINHLSFPQREILVEHVHGPMPINRRDATRNTTVQALLKSNLLRGATPGIRPHETELTDKGREIVSHILANYAEALIAAGCLEVDDNTARALQPIEMLRRLRTRKRPEAPAPAEVPATRATKTA